MRILLTAIFFALISISVTAQTVTYKVFLDQLESKEVNVVVELNGFKTLDVASYQMPAWAPGAYTITNYGRFLKNFKALDEKKNEIPVARIDENRWEVKSAQHLKFFSYTVTNSYFDSTSLYFALCHIDTNYFFANGTALFGYVNDRKDVRDTVVYYTNLELGYGRVKDGGTQIFSPLTVARDAVVFFADSGQISNLLQTHQAKLSKPKTFGLISYIASNYDELADAPVLAGTKLNVREFQQDGAKYVIALASDEAFPMDSLANATKAIVKSQTDFFGDTPFKSYYFLINAPTYLHLPSQAMGALEHANSSAYLMLNMPWEGFKQFGLPVISHEFFHLWNVKRIHSNKLGPFDYTKAVKTTSLWLSEGVTDYYAQTLLTRNGILPPSYFEGKLNEWQSATRHSRSANQETLEQLSLDESDFSMEKALSFYTKAPLVALMLDLEIRSRTENKKSLDDVMHSLYAQAKVGNHFKDEELLGRVEQFTGLDLKDFYKRYIGGSDSLPLASYFLKMGIEKDVQRSEPIGINFHQHLSFNEDFAIIDSLFPKSELVEAGAGVGDTIISINDKKINKEDLMQFSRNNNAPQVLKLLIGSKKKRFAKNVVLTEPLYYNEIKKSIAPVEKPSALQIAIRKGIYGG